MQPPRNIQVKDWHREAKPMQKLALLPSAKKTIVDYATVLMHIMVVHTHCII